jgi:uncharacterized protein GlcG (DUF336 family)
MMTIRRLDLADAQLLVEAAVEKAVQMGVPQCVAVADEAGTLIAFERMDGGKVSSVSIAIDKAFTAAVARNATSFYGQVSQPGGPAWGINQTNMGHFNVIGGGLPVIVDGTVVGGVGVSSGTAVQDEEVAQAAVDAFAARAASQSGSS